MTDILAKHGEAILNSFLGDQSNARAYLGFVFSNCFSHRYFTLFVEKVIPNQASFGLSMFKLVPWNLT